MVQAAERLENQTTLNLRVENKILSYVSLNHSSFNQPLDIDKMVFTSGGIFIINYNEAKGMIDGSQDRPIWLSEGDVRIKNPLIENEKKIDSLKMVIPPYFHDYFYSIVGFKKRVKINVPGNHKNIEGNQWMLSESEISEYIERVILKKNVQQNQPIKPHHLNILERGLRWMSQ
ncbi:nuclease-related domain-containing protein [Jeotgalibacillus salarius]|uniref:NERD domain-containing protein n=1 Tax=Jeotgalibacillus salarius TaxID=546023 RepID=A0A4Y8LLU4_9BACL|nr:nuclease-related domain-containing protein [Jeotgalibacillus salarius]TFE04012.1 NERD domain-containing protein [Jeotgalibacillus salarius]